MASALDVCILGAGASGLACAVECARGLRRAGDETTRVVVLEAGSKPGRSILASGNGRCNFSNLVLSSSKKRGMYRNAEFAEAAAEALGSTSAVGVLPWFRQLGLVWRADDAGLGMLYPYSNKASTVLDVLLAACERWGVEIMPELRISMVEFVPGECAGFFLKGERAFEKSRTKTAKGRIKRELSWKPVELRSKKLVLAVGGALGEEELASIVPDHDVVAFGPVLTALDVVGEDLLGLDGVRAKVSACVLEAKPSSESGERQGQDGACEFQESGEILFREHQLSGILSFNLSRQLPYGGYLALDFAPEYDARDLLDLLTFMAKSTGARTSDELLRGMFAPALARALARKANIAAPAHGHSAPSPKSTLPKEDIAELARVIKRFELEVSGASSTHAPQVHRGGVAVEQVNPASLESKKTPGLFVLGEALDVDGPCGGYNLDWAWTSGVLAGQAIFKEILH
ncbi:MAG: NAD(P)/FAD-dependent oxidoreductase [Coriobacteriia bacterium]|nr:NAD(P)/FAD-dependent oxidoreductase [Coriobacteriia bacterium]